MGVSIFRFLFEPQLPLNKQSVYTQEKLGDEKVTKKKVSCSMFRANVFVYIEYISPPMQLLGGCTSYNFGANRREEEDDHDLRSLFCGISLYGVFWTSWNCLECLVSSHDSKNSWRSGTQEILDSDLESHSINELKQRLCYHRHCHSGLASCEGPFKRLVYIPSEKSWLSPYKEPKKFL